jgi:PAS domain S-box-containing protein
MQADILKDEQTRLLYVGLPSALAVNTLLALILVTILRSVIAPNILFGWLALLGTILLARAVLLAAWRRSGSNAANYNPRWIYRFRISVIATGMAWGIGAVLLFPAGDVPHQAFLAFVLAGLCSGASTTLAADRVSMFGFLVPTLLPLVVRFGMEDGEITLAMSVMSALFLIFLSMSAARLGRGLQENLRLRVKATTREQAMQKNAAELREAKNQSEELNHMLHTVLDTIPVRIFWKDRNLVYLGCNRIFAQDAGKHSPQEVVGTTDYDMGWREVADLYRTDDALVMETNRPKLNFEEQQTHSDGTTTWLRTSKVPLRDAAGEVIGVLGTYEDITEEKQIGKALIAAKDAAEAANRAKSEFLASMSHELRTPLNAILGFSQLFGMDPELTEDTKEQAREIERAGQHLLSLVNDLIDLARIEAGKLELSPEPVPVKSVLVDSLAMMAPIARKQGIELVDENSKELEMTVSTDYTRLRQVVINLLSNAIKYNRPQGTVRLSCRMNDGKVRISIADTGPGIPANKQSRIFNAFDRLGTEGGTIEGTGIGLVITKRIVEAMDGSIGFESTEGHGSTFWVEFPTSETVALSASTVAALASVPEAISQPTARPVVLYIEDNPMNLRLMQQIFKRKDLELRDAHTAEIGIELARAEPPALILMDINLPGMDGYEALKVLKADARTALIPVVAISANAMMGDEERGLAAGFIAYFTKPLDIPSLYDALGKLIVKPAV